MTTKKKKMKRKKIEFRTLEVVKEENKAPKYFLASILHKYNFEKQICLYSLTLNIEHCFFYNHVLSFQ